MLSDMLPFAREPELAKRQSERERGEGESERDRERKHEREGEREIKRVREVTRDGHA